MTDALEDHEGTVTTGGRTLTNLHFADDTDGERTGENGENWLRNHLCCPKDSRGQGIDGGEGRYSIISQHIFSPQF